MTVEELHRQFELLWLRKRFPEALACAKAELASAMSAGAPLGDHLDLARALLDLAMAQKASGSVEEAEHNRQEAQTMMSALREKAERLTHDLSTADFHIFEAERLWWEPESLPEARRRLEEAQKIREMHHGPDHPAVAAVMARRGELEFVSGAFAAAEPFYRWALRIYDARGAKQDPYYRKTLQGLAQTLGALGQDAEANVLFTKAIDELSAWPEEKFALYFLLITQAETLDRLKRPDQAQLARVRAEGLLPKGNPGVFGYNPGDVTGN